MKKFLTLLLVAVMVLSLFGCGESKQEAPVLKVGFAMENVTPDYNVGLGGYSDSESRTSTGVLDPIYATCIAYQYGEQTVLMYTLDVSAAPDGMTKTVQDMISKSTGVPADHIIVTATHTHSAPSVTGDGENTSRFKADLYGGMTTAAQNALADLAPATMHTGMTEIDGMNFDRHYIMSDGQYEDYTEDITYAAHCTESDKRMMLLKFDREEKKDILLVNWQAHPDHAHQNGYTMISADYPGALRNYVTEETDMLVAFIPGASGNQNPNSKVQSEKTGLKMNQYGKKLGEFAVEALDSLKQVGAEGIAITSKVVDTEVDHSLDNMVKQANEVYNVWKSQGMDAGDALAKEYGIYGVYHARAIRDRKTMAATKPLTLYALRIGDVGFSSGMYEMFSDAGMYIRENSSFETVFICQGNYSYIASEWAFDYRTYESNTGYYAKGTAEMLAKEFVSLLETVKK